MTYSKLVQQDLVQFVSLRKIQMQTPELDVVIKNRVHIYDINMTGASFDDVHSLAYVSTQGSNKRIIGSGLIDEEDGRATQLAGGQFGATRQIDSAFNSLLFTLPFEVIRSVRSDGLTAAEGGTGNLNYRYSRVYTNISVDPSTGETTHWYNSGTNIINILSVRSRCSIITCSGAELCCFNQHWYVYTNK